jgi:uncharacterized membrane protein
MRIVEFLKTAVIGGIIFLVPFVVILIIIAKAFEFMKAFATPFVAFIPFHSVGGILLINLLAIVGILLVCFFAGLFAKSLTADKIVKKLETSVLSKIPIYPFIKGMMGSLPGTAEFEDLKSVLVRLDDYWQVAFEIERLDDGRVVIFLPGAPNPLSGAVCIMTEDRVQALNTTMIEVSQNLTGFGKETGKLLAK